MFKSTSPNDHYIPMALQQRSHPLHDDSHGIGAGVEIDLLEAGYQQRVVAVPQSEIILQVGNQLFAEMIEFVVSELGKFIHLSGVEV